MTGGEVLQELRAHPSLASIPVLVCSGMPPDELRAQLGTQNDPRVVVLGKPFDLDVFVETVQRMLQTHTVDGTDQILVPARP